MSQASFSHYKLSEPIVRALDSLGYEQPTDVQVEVIPVALEKRTCCQIANRQRQDGGVWHPDL